MKRFFITIASGLAILTLAGCTLSLLIPPTPTPIILPSQTPLLATITLAAPTATVPSPTMSLPTVTTGASTPVITGPTPTTGGIISGTPSGPYAVILVSPGSTLTVHAGPGAGTAVLGSLPATATNVMRAGPSSNVAGELWVQVQSPSGGWVKASFLTEYAAPATFCADTRVIALITNFGNALKASNGVTLASFVSPAHGLAIRLWRYSDPIVFDREHARWVFESTYSHNWGAAPASGQDTTGSFHEVVLPMLLDVFNAPAPGYTLGCNTVGLGGASYTVTWPPEYSNVNFYSLYKPGPVGDELSWRTLLLGVDFVQGQPYVFSVTQLNWEP